MDFIDQVRALASRVAVAKNLLQTEEATKNAMVMPFIQLLGYNVFDPMEVTPELIADVGTKKGEKVDYAILKDGKPIMLFECKKSGGDLSINHASQLFRYFHVTEARFGVLTNGLVYRFFTDLEKPNKMDEKPFFEFNILDFRDQDVDELKKFAKAAFDVESILTTAHHLKYTRAIQNTLTDWMTNPPEDFVRLVSAEFLAGKQFRSAVKDQFTLITKRAFQQLVGDKINERLKGAMTPEPVLTPEVAVIAEDQATAAEAFVPSTLELEAFQVIRAILRPVVKPGRIFIRDAASYCAILFDDNNRKPICRLRFNNESKLVIGVFGESKEEERVAISSVDDIFDFADRLSACVVGYLNAGKAAEPAAAGAA
ncbi:type I restriction endonuclease [Variovorax arabinosiphilus]|uniref:type I restriction endonuclease n=1 Tax=Variovorax arabinosiphilus TaxID=3053498 RepID=UPI0025780B61|nr:MULTISPECIES: type I restriction endonuclease [unclassified Variovorax]MDM0121896.1 type I restriction endonuclease [Variovorax sp. J2L1-78]MDM0131574.1 type I restriction endonuclease [Variovorax sp. J2L1-63]MDM0234659.1 type I restriction endonuclease [Variovorax sp. J2R1-6]